MTEHNWKIQERRVAKKLGTLRNRCSGSSGRSDLSSSDTLHPNLYVECKYGRKNSYVIGLFKQVLQKALAEGKIPILALKEKGSKHDYIFMRLDDLVKASGFIKDGGQVSNINFSSDPQ